MANNTQHTYDNFWQFSVLQYSKLKPKLLELQDCAHCNINLILAALYLDSHSEQLSVEHWQQLIKAVEVIDIEVQTQRKVRRQLSKSRSQDYKAALDRELALEKKQQQSIIDWVNSSQRYCEKYGNLRHYSIATNVADTWATAICQLQNYPV